MRGLDVLTIISSDSRFPLDATALLREGRLRSVRTFRSAQECFRAFDLEEGLSGRVVVVDSVVSDISPLNLCDALRLRYGVIEVLLVVADQSAATLERAMLAGARATVAREAANEEFTRVVVRVIELAGARGEAGSGGVGGGVGSGVATLPGLGRSLRGSTGAAACLPSTVLSVVSARGGAGKTTLSALLAGLAARCAVDTALVDFDLQFGDLGFVFGGGSGQNLYEFARELDEGGADPRRFARTVGEGLSLYVPDAVPEKAELLTGKVGAVIDTLRANHRLVVVNTGSFWTLFHAELIERSDLAICVLDPTAGAVRATRALAGMCRRLGLPGSGMLYVANRCQAELLSQRDLAELLGVEEVAALSDGGPELTVMLDSGRIDELIERGDRVVAEAGLLLDEIAVRCELELHSMAGMYASMRRGQRNLHSQRRPQPERDLRPERELRRKRGARIEQGGQGHPERKDPPCRY
ncbi:MAG: hypothetical protein LBJ07_03360 [Actinomycetes bacterium]|jgi:MinD-like ATPase involved in chromosome partitioning or flagellar assembly/CheY-like chemotaxis protein|nr:hypothetical protein [Actinomycetes bacterium]